MKNLFLFFAISSLSIASISSQVLEKGVIYPIDHLTSNSEILYASYDSTNEQTTVEILESANENFVTIRTCVFNSNLKLVTESKRTFKIAEFDLLMEILRGESKRVYATSKSLYLGVEAVVEAVNEMKERFERNGEAISITENIVREKTNGTIEISQVLQEGNYSAVINEYIPTKIKTVNEVEITGIDGEKIVLYTWFFNSQTGEFIVLAGVKAEDGDKSKLHEARHFQLIKVNKDFTVDYLQKLDFDYNMGISFQKTIHNSTEIIPSKQKRNEIYDSRVILIFSPIHLSRGKENTSPDPGNGHVLIIDGNGNALNNEPFHFPSGGWVIDDVVNSPYTDEMILYGSAQQDKYINQVKDIYLPFNSVKMIPQNIKWKQFQIMKISGNKVSWVTNVSVEDINANIQTTASSRGKTHYDGERFLMQQVLLTAHGDFYFCGQNREKKSITDSKKIGSDIQYGDLILLHFENTGDLRASYGIKKKESNKYSKSFATPQYFYVNSTGESLIWLFGEIEGKNMDHLMVTPVLFEINLETTEMKYFLSYNLKKSGKPNYFTSIYFPHVLIFKDNSILIIARDKKFNNLSFAKISLRGN